MKVSVYSHCQVCVFLIPHRIYNLLIFSSEGRCSPTHQRQIQALQLPSSRLEDVSE